MTDDIPMMGLSPTPQAEPWPSPILSTFPAGDEIWPEQAGSAKCPQCVFQKVVIGGFLLPHNHYCERDGVGYLVGWFEDGTAWAIKASREPGVLKHVSGAPIAPGQREATP